MVDDNLVKLASFGTAGISILAVFITGVIIYRLPNNVSKEKIGILKFFIISCFIFVILSTGTGIANAVFNQQKIEKKEEKIVEVTEQYENERASWLRYKADVTQEFNRLENQLNQPGINKELLRSNIKELSSRTMNMQFKPVN